MKTTESSQNNNIRRTAVVGLIGAVASIGFYAGSKGHDAISEAMRKSQENNTFSQPGIGNTFLEQGIDPKTVKVWTVMPGEHTPIDVARDLHAKDVLKVGDEISSQVGQYMHQGDTIVVPLDQLKPSPGQPNAQQ